MGKFVGFILIIVFTWYMFSNPTEFGENRKHAKFLLGWIGLGFGEFVGFIIVLICFPSQPNSQQTSW